MSPVKNPAVSNIYKKIWGVRGLDPKPPPLADFPLLIILIKSFVFFSPNYEPNNTLTCSLWVIYVGFIRSV